MTILIKVKQCFVPLRLFLIFIITAFISVISIEAKAEYYEGCGPACDVSGIYWQPAPRYLPCKPHLKKRHVIHRRHYQKVIVVHVYSGCSNRCGSPRCCYDDCCGNYNPDLTTGDDDPSVYPDLDIDR